MPSHNLGKQTGCMERMGGIIKWKKSKEDPRSSERICVYASGKFSTTQSTIDAEINACINTLEKLKIYYLDKQEVTLRTDCQAIIKCTGEMKELAAAALYSVEEVLQSPNAFQKNMKTTCEEISPHPNLQTFQHQKKQFEKPCDPTIKQTMQRPKYALYNQPKTTTGQTKEKMFEFKTKKPEESSSNWKPWHKDWDAITSNHSEDEQIKDVGKYQLQIGTDF
ncbi:putative polyprotein [Tanacetum coccineum]